MRPSLRASVALAVLALVVPACNCDNGGGGDAGTDAGPPDAGPPDAGPPDAGPPDAGPPDAGPPDAGPPDAGPPDAGPAPIDAGCAFEPDGGPVVPDGGPTCVSTGTLPGFLYYGRAAADAGLNGTVWVRSGDGLVDRQVTSGARPALSSDGRYLAVLRNGGHGLAENSQGDLWLHDLLTGAELPLYLNNDYVVASSFVPDAGTLVFDYQCTLLQTPLDGGPGTGFPAWGGCYTDMPAVSPDGRQVAVRNLFNGLGLEDLDGQHQRFFFPVTAGHISSCPRWSPDMEWLSYVDGPADTLTGQARRLHLDGGSDQALSKADVCGQPLLVSGPAAWTPDGRWAVTAGTGSGVNALYALSTDGSGGTLRLCVSPGPPVLWAGAWVPALPVVP